MRLRENLCLRFRLGMTPISLHISRCWLDQSLGISDIHVETTEALDNKGADQRKRMCKNMFSHDKGSILQTKAI